jgi:molybdate transport system substrate-binding protein
MIYRPLLLFLLLSLTLQAAYVKIAVAANLSFVLPELIADFQKNHPDIKIQKTLSGSGKLASQILHAAPYEIFLSANKDYPKKLYRQNRGLREPQIYAKGSLVLLSVTKRDFSQGMALIKHNNIKRIAIANPKTAPYGKATLEALKNAQLYKAVMKKLIYGESIAQTLAYTMHASDLGFIAKSAIYAPQLRHFQKNKNWIDVPKHLYTPIEQAAILLKPAKNNPAALAFYNYLFSKEAHKIFQKYGYQ